MKCFTLHVINLKYMKVSLFEISYKKKWTFSPYSRCTCRSVFANHHFRSGLRSADHKSFNLRNDSRTRSEVLIWTKRFTNEPTPKFWCKSNNSWCTIRLERFEKENHWRNGFTDLLFIILFLLNSMLHTETKQSKGKEKRQRKKYMQPARVNN